MASSVQEALMERHICSSILSCGLALAFAVPALAGDVTMQLEAGSGFSIKNGTGAIERLRVDEATGNISRNGALFVHTTGGTFVGAGAGANTTLYAFSNSGFGDSALQANTTGHSNSAFGAFALAVNTTGGGNSAFGSGALESNTTGGTNAAFGNTALGFNRTGLRNSAFGPGSLRYNDSGSDNVAMGYGALRYNTGSYNTALGTRALELKSTGTSNIAIGAGAGSGLLNGSANIYIGNTGGSFTESGRIRVGTPGIHTATRVAGIRGVTTGQANAIPVLIDSDGQLGTASSSREVKTDIRDMGDATARLLELRPVTFRYREQSQTLPGGGTAPPEYGLVAEEVAEVFPDLVVYDDAGRPFTVKYQELAPMLLNEMKRQRLEYEQRIDALTARLERLETR
jgi:hypothetical protein